MGNNTLLFQGVPSPTKILISGLEGLCARLADSLGRSGRRARTPGSVRECEKQPRSLQPDHTGSSVAVGASQRLTEGLMAACLLAPVKPLAASPSRLSIRTTDDRPAVRLTVECIPASSRCTTKPALVEAAGRGLGLGAPLSSPPPACQKLRCLPAARPHRGGEREGDGERECF